MSGSREVHAVAAGEEFAVSPRIRSETEALANLLQSHAGAHFTFALVELATWRTSDGAILCVPDLLTRTVMIERGVVRLPDSGVTIEPTRVEAKPRAQSISMGDFMGRMAELDPDLPREIYALLDALEPLGVYPELKASLNLYADFPQLSRPANFGFIDKAGKFWTNPASWKLSESVWRPYFEAVATMIGGQIIDEPNNRFVAIEGRSAPRITDLLPEHRDDLISAIANAVKLLRNESD